MNNSENSPDFLNLNNQLILARKEINNLRQQLKSLKHIQRKEHDEILLKLRDFHCENCEKCTCGTVRSHEATNERSCSSDNAINLNYIGLIRSPFSSKRGTPRQPSICKDAVGKLIIDNTVFTNPHHALEGLEQFSHMWIIYHFNQTESTHIPAKVTPPRLNGVKTGVFGTRSPHRPSPIGLSLVKIIKIQDNVISFCGVDMVDQTPVLDIKPYIPHYDSPEMNSPNNSAHNDTEENANDNSEEEISRRSSDEHRENNIITGNDERRTLEGADSNESRNNFETSRPDSRMGEREAPDGEEEGTENPVNRQLEESVRLPSWVNNHIPSLQVVFKMSAEIQLRQLGAEAEEKKRMIKNILSEDPRSVYLRERQRNCPYVFRIANLNVSCEFKDEEETVFVFQVVKTSDIEMNE